MTLADLQRSNPFWFAGLSRRGGTPLAQVFTARRGGVFFVVKDKPSGFAKFRFEVCRFDSVNGDVKATVPPRWFYNEGAALLAAKAAAEE